MVSMPSRKKRSAVSRWPLAEAAVEPKAASVWPTEPRPRRTVIEPGVPGLNAGNQLRELDEVAAVQRELHDFRRIDDGADSGVLGLQNAAVAATSMLSVTLPIVSLKSMRAVCCTCKVSRSTFWD